MKNIYIICCLLATMFGYSFGQTTRITYPLNGMIFQQNQNGYATIPFAAHVSGSADLNHSNYGYYIEKLNLTTGQVIPGLPKERTVTTLAANVQANYFKSISSTISNLPKGWYTFFSSQIFLTSISINHY